MVENARAGLVVVGDDGSPAADIVWQWLTMHPWDGWEVEIVTADEASLAWGEAIIGKPWSPSWSRAGNPPGAASVVYLQYASDPRVMLAERSDADVVVVGRHSDAGPFDLPYLGSTSEWLMQNPPAPLAVIGRAERMEKVLVAFDGSPHARRAMDSFASLPAAADAAVLIATVDDGRTDPAMLDEAASLLERRVASVETEVRSGKPTKAILEAIEETGADLAVLGTRGLTGWKRIRVGSTAGAVVRRAQCNVLVAAAEAG